MYKLPGHVEAEQNLIGIILNNNSIYIEVKDSIKLEYFFLPIHAEIYRIIDILYKNNIIFDPITIGNYFYKNALSKKNNLNKYKYLIKIFIETKINTNITSLCKIIYDFYIRRKIVFINEKAIDSICNIKVNIESTLENLEENIKHAYIYCNKKHCHFIFELNKKLLSKTKINNFNSYMIGINTGFHELNKITNGFHKSDFIIIAGRPSMGKTALSLNIATNASISFLNKNFSNNIKYVYFISLEMSAEQIACRIISMKTGINLMSIRSGNLNRQDIKKIFNYTAMSENLPLLIDDSSSLNLLEVKNRIKKININNNIGLLIIDYLQLILPYDYKKDNRVNEVSRISRGIKILAKEINIPIIVTSQLSRALELRDNKRPILSDLRDSGNIEQDADMVIFIYREEYYLSRRQPNGINNFKLWQKRLECNKNIAEIIIAKYRNGPVGSFNLLFNKSTASFAN